jgi:hypothetical protein
MNSKACTRPWLPPQPTNTPHGPGRLTNQPSCPWAKVWSPPGKLNQHKTRTWEVVHKNPRPWKAELLHDLPSEWHRRTDCDVFQEELLPLREPTKLLQWQY